MVDFKERKSDILSSDISGIFSMVKARVLSQSSDHGKPQTKTDQYSAADGSAGYALPNSCQPDIPSRIFTSDYHYRYNFVVGQSLVRMVLSCRNTIGLDAPEILEKKSTGRW
jgi:hypothetical protein